MRKDTDPNFITSEYLSKWRSRQKKKKASVLVCSFLAVVVALTTVAEMIQPAVTVTRKESVLDCGFPVHEHTEECYETLYDEYGNETGKELICDKADYIIHQHTEECYKTVTHEDEQLEEKVLICDLPEIKKHEHDDSCYEDKEVLICNTEEHTHDDSCYETTYNLICAEEHEHTDYCYEPVYNLVCGKEEHVHNETCYETQKELICDKLELHKHDESCYDEEGNRICGKIELLEHNHTEDCVKVVEVVDEDKLPEQKFYGETDQLTVSVIAPEGAFPKDTTMKVAMVDDEDVLNAAASAAESADTQVTNVQAADITFFDTEGNEIQPLVPIQVILTPIERLPSEEETAAVYHIDDEGVAKEVEQTEPVLEENITTEAMVFDTDSFSVYALVYTVDFEYNGYTYSLTGGERIALSELVEMLGILSGTNYESTDAFLADVEDVEFSNPELVKVGKMEEMSGVFGSEDWGLESLLPFDTEETLTIKMKDGTEIVIVVTDEQIKKTVIDAKGGTWEIIVTYGEDAQIPEGAELKVKEILPEDEEYDTLYEESIAATGKVAEDQGAELPIITVNRLFDIEIHGTNGKIEPASPVKVNIRMVGEKKETDQLSVVHFAENGIESMDSTEVETTTEDAYEVSFNTESFSVYAVQIFSNLDYLNEAKYALVCERGSDITSADGENSVTNYALTDSYNSGTLAGKGVYKDGNTVGGFVTQWGFESAGNNQYLIYMMDGDTKKYVKVSGNNLILDSTGTAFTTQVTNNKVRFSYNGQSITSVGDNPSRFVLQNNTGDESLFSICKLDPDYEEKTAKKVSVADWKSSSAGDGKWNENDTVVIYRKILHDDGSEEFYALATDGSLIPVYDGGDTIYYHCPEGKSVYWHVALGANGYYVSSVVPEGSSEATVYLAPSVTDNTWSSSSPVGLTMNGLASDGHYGTTIENWDQRTYAYAGLHVDTAAISDGIKPGSGVSSDTFFFAVADTLISDGELHTVSTVDSTAKGITMKIFNYSGDTYHFGYRNAAMQAIMGNDMLDDWDNRKSHVTKTVSSKLGNDGFPVSLSNGNSYAPLYTVGTTINYPERWHKYDWDTSDVKDYDAGSITVQGGDANHLFLQSYYDENGMFRYSSMENFAQYNNGTGDFTVYRETGTPNIPTQSDHYYYYHGHFMPYNTLDPSVSVSRIVDQYGSITDKELGRSFENVYGLNETPDYYVGLTLEASFVQPKGGTLENGDPVIYRFTGDDDLLVYIDGILVLDVGGIHEPLTGSINFETGEILQPNYYDEGDGWETHSTTLYAVFKDAYDNHLISDDEWSKMTWKDVDGDGNPDTFADYSTHSFNMFYMERGAGASNLDLAFNLQVIKDDEFTVQKDLPEDIDPRFANQSYKFQATFMDGSVEKPLYKNATNSQGEVVCTKVIYKDRRDEDGRPIEVEVPVDNYGYFYLKAGEAAIFMIADETIEYNVKEVDISSYNLEEITISGGGNTEHVEINNNQVTIENNTAEAGMARVEDRSNLYYTNYPKTQSLLITKHIGDYNEAHVLTRQDYPEETNPVFEFRVYMESKDAEGNTKLVPYSYAPYYLTKEVNGEKHYFTLDGGDNNAPNDHGTTVTVCSKTGRSGSINSIPPEYTIEIPNLLIGTHFYLEERRDNIPHDYMFVVEDLTEGTYGDPTLTHIDRLIARDETDHQTFDPETVGQIIADTDAESHVWNKYIPFELKVEKDWSGIDPTDTDLTNAEITVTLGRYTLQNKAGTLTIEKVNVPADANLSATYEVRDDANDMVATFNYIKGVSTVATIPLAPGTYTVTESIVSDDEAYTSSHPDSGIAKTVMIDDEGSATVTFGSSYTEKTGSLYIQSTVDLSDSNVDFTQVTYTVYDSNNNQVGEIYSYNQVKGGLTIPNLRIGTYTVVESSVPYNPDYSITRTPDASHNARSAIEVEVSEGTDGDERKALFSTIYEEIQESGSTYLLMKPEAWDRTGTTHITGDVEYPVGTQVALVFYTTDVWDRIDNLKTLEGYSDLKNCITYNGVPLPQNYNGKAYITETVNGELKYTIPFTVERNALLKVIINAEKNESHGWSIIPYEANTQNSVPRIMAVNRQVKAGGNASLDVMNNADTPEPPDVNKKYVPDTVFNNSNYTVVLTYNNWSEVVKDLAPRDADGNLYYYYIQSVSETGLPEGTTASITTDADGKKLFVSQGDSGSLSLSVLNTVPLISSDIIIYKEDGNTHSKLDGAVFYLMKGKILMTDLTVNSLGDGNSEIPVDSDGCFVVPAAGAKISGLTAGDYKLIESNPPAGYIITTDGYEFSVSSKGIVTGPEGIVEGITFTIPNEPGAELPMTGGIGTRMFTILGGLLITLSGVLLLRKRKKTE